MPEITDRRYAHDLDHADPLREFRGRFVGLGSTDNADLIYLDGNSLGRLPARSVSRLHEVVEEQWGRGLIRSWERWIDLPAQVGDLLGQSVLGAAPGQVVLSDSTTVNLFKLASAALRARAGRHTVVTDAHDFPTDRFVLEGLAAAGGLRVVQIEADPVQGCSAADVAAMVDADTALVSLSHVDYRSGAVADMRAITQVAHDSGALMLWDLSHAAGSVVIDLDGAGVDLAVGCTYKYLNGGPGAPAYLYVRRDVQTSLRQPIWGWFGQREQFAMGPAYDPVDGIERFTTGTPAILGITLVEDGVRLLAEAGMDAVQAKGRALTSYLVELADRWLTPLGFELASPADPVRRGSHVSLRHDSAYQICRALIEYAAVVPDFRRPDLVRLGCSALTTSFADVYEGMRRLRDLVASGKYLDIEISAGSMPRVT